jgi:2-hydroxychromene-2-carboxylate isomerase
MQTSTWLRSKFMMRLSSGRFQSRRQRQGRRARGPEGAVVHYFHQVDDPYSHLAVQKLPALAARYAVTFRPHLAAAPEPPFRGDAQDFDTWAWRDAQAIAEGFGTAFTPALITPEAQASAAVAHVLAGHQDASAFAESALELGTRLWAGAPLPSAPPGAGAAALQAGTALRKKLGHYQGAMFYFEGEWYWGIDRLRVLEARLGEEGFDRLGGAPLVPEPRAERTAHAGAVTLEYFPSLRSPYTAVGHTRVCELLTRTGATLKLRPVMPMMMRGVPNPGPKQRYIITDAGREGRWYGAPLKRIVDPFGAPVLRAFTLYPGAEALGAGLPFVTAYLRAAWQEGIDISGDRGLQWVAAEAGLNWDRLKAEAAHHHWEQILEDNLQALKAEALWGVPSFRVSGGAEPQPYACWGQDRIWRVETEIARRNR